MDIQLAQKILLAQLALALVGVDPDGSGEVLANQLQLTPVLPALHVTFVGRACAERYGETDDETKHGEQQVADIERSNKCRNASDRSRPTSDDEQRDDHLGQHGTVHTHEEGPFRMFGHVAGTNLD